MKLGHYKLFSMVNNLFGYFTMLWAPSKTKTEPVCHPKAHTCIPNDEDDDHDADDDAAQDADEDRWPRAANDGHWPVAGQPGHKWVTA